MTKYKDIVNYLRALKARVEIIRADKEAENYKEESLEEAFKKSLAMVWDKLSNLYEDDLTDLYKVQGFLTDEVVQIHKEENSENNQKLAKNNLNFARICEDFEDGKRAYNMYFFNDKGAETYIVGDLHSDTISLERILEKTDFFKGVEDNKELRLIFLGDYIDRGQAQLKIIHYILALKYLFPDKIYLLRGNHDGGSCADGQVKMWVKQPEGSPDQDWFLLYIHSLSLINTSYPETAIKKNLEFFDSLASLGFICRRRKIILSHGGIPRPKREEAALYSYIKSLYDLTNEAITDKLGKSIVNNMMWSDPAADTDDLHEDRARFRFKNQDFECFRSLLGIDLLVRGHQVQEGGYKEFFDGGIVNIFSSGRIIKGEEDINIETAYTRVDPHIVSLDKDGQIKYIGLNNQ